MSEELQQSNSSMDVTCPICNNFFSQSEIEEHANKCIFLNCTDDQQQKRKRTPSPVLHGSGTLPKFSFSQKSPRDVKSTTIKTSRKGFASAPLFQKMAKNKASKSSSDEVITIVEDEKECIKNTIIKKPYDLTFKVPLAVQVRPKTLEEFFGQKHILGKGSVLHSLLEKGDIPNMMLWGPPGCGKTSLSHVVQEICKKNITKWKFVTLCAATCGIKEVQQVVTVAKNDLKFGKRTVLFMDEIHRYIC